MDIGMGWGQGRDHKLSAIEDFENIAWNPAGELQQSITNFSIHLRARTGESG
jgi:hypothetical protein